MNLNSINSTHKSRFTCASLQTMYSSENLENIFLLYKSINKYLLNTCQVLCRYKESIRFDPCLQEAYIVQLEGCDRVFGKLMRLQKPLIFPQTEFI